MKVFESFIRFIKKYLIEMPSLSQILNAKIGSGGHSKAYVASQLGVGEKTIENYMRGLRSPKPDVIVKLGRILKFDLSQLSEQNVPPTKPETPQNGAKSQPLSRIGQVVKDVQYLTGLTIEQVADRIHYSRSRLTTLVNGGDSKKVYDLLQKEFAKELKSDKLTTVTTRPIFDVKPTFGPDKDATIKSQADALKDQGESLLILAKILASKENVK